MIAHPKLENKLPVPNAPCGVESFGAQLSSTFSGISS